MNIDLKKILVLCILLCFFIQSSVFARNINELYIVKHSRLDNYITQLENKLKISKFNDSIIYSNTNDFYYIRLYQDNENLNVFINCNKHTQQQLSEIIKSTQNKAYLINDKDLKNKYINDLKSFMAINNIDNNTIKVKRNKYNPYNKKLKNKILKTTKYVNNNIYFTANKVEMQTKIKRYVNGFEIIVTNNTGSNIILKEVASGDFIGLTEIAKKAALPEVVDFIPIYGIIAGVKTDLEKNRFTRPFPINYTIKNSENVRLLGLSNLQVYPIIDFIFEINGKTKKIQFITY